MARLPVVGETNWGPTLSEFLRVSHNEDGTLKNHHRRSGLWCGG